MGMRLVRGAGTGERGPAVVRLVVRLAVRDLRLHRDLCQECPESEMDRMISMTAFVQVVERGTFAAAARQLEVSPATVTHHVQSLEDRLGIQLLNRTTRKISLTEAGAVFYERAVQILGEVEDAERLASA